MDHIQEVNRTRQVLLQKKRTAELSEDEETTIAAAIAECKEFVRTRNGTPKSFADLDRLIGGITALCDRCGAQYGHPGPCHYCVPSYGPSIQRALDLAHKAHRMEFRKPPSRIPYLAHVFDGVSLLGYWGFDADHHHTIFETMLLHDAVENHGVTYDEIQQACGHIVADHVLELTIPTPPPETSWKDAKEAYMRGFGEKTVLALVVKVADRVCNVRDFMQTDRTYARKYFRAASGLFAAMHARREDIVSTYGVHIFLQMKSTVNFLNHQLESR